MAAVSGLGPELDRAPVRRPGSAGIAPPLPRKRTALRLLGYVSGLALLAWLGWQVVANTSPTRPGNDARVAAALSSAEHLQRVGEAVDWAAISRTAQDILRDAPLESRAFFLLGLAAEADEQENEAAELMGVAAGRSLRNRGAHLWLFRHRLKEREFGTALHHADVILRTRRQLGGTLLPGLMAIALVDDGRTALVRMLETGPPWRSWFLAAFSKQGAGPSDPAPLYAVLQAGRLPPSSGELRPYLDRLISSDRFEQAFLAWLSSLPPEETQRMSYLSNGDFERPVSNLAFDWLIGRPRGAEIDIADSPAGEGKALRIRFARARVSFRHVRKLVMLPPGDYELSGTARSLDLGSERGLQWRVSCAERPKASLASTAPVRGTIAAEISARFSVPSRGCRAQWLQLELAARIPSEQDVAGGSAWFDALQIRQIETQLSQPRLP